MVRLRAGAQFTGPRCRRRSGSLCPNPCRIWPSATEMRRAATARPFLKATAAGSPFSTRSWISACGTSWRESAFINAAILVRPTTGRPTFRIRPYRAPLGPASVIRTASSASSLSRPSCSPPLTARATGPVRLSQQGRDLAVAHVEDVVEEKDGALGGREPLEQHQERHRDLVDHLDTPDAGLVQIDGLWQAIAPALLASRARRAELIEAQARDRRQQDRK